MIASLPMYDWPEIRPATDAFWRALTGELRARGIDAPDELDRTRAADKQWRDPDLLLSQTCGFPYVTGLRDTVRLVATPVYAVDGCDGSDYSSFLLVHRDCPAEDLAGLAPRTIAVNTPDSQSGWNALRHTVLRDTGRPVDAGGLLLTGSHRQSIRAVARGEADLCAVDPVCYALAGRFEPETTAAVRILARSDPTPTLPLITSGRAGDDILARLREALDAVISAPAVADVAQELAIAGFHRLTDRDYDRIRVIEPVAGQNA